jgi:hypothetical protein
MLEAVKFADFRGSKGRPVPIEIRIGIHTGLVVIDEIGAEAEKKMDIIGETPNIAARLMSLAEPNSLVVSASTYRLVSGFFEEEDLGPQVVRGISQPIEVYRILHESTARTRLEARGLEGLTPLIGRDSEMGRLQTLWNSVVEGEGQTVLVSGEAGIGKSRITGALKLHIAKEHNAWLTETECSPYHQNTAFYPISQLLQRTVLAFQPEDSAETRYGKLEGFLVQNGFDLAENVPLLSPILSLPPNPKYQPLDPLAMSTRQKTLALLLNLLMNRASVQPTLFILEDLHWADPSTLELAGMVIQQAPTARLMAFLTFRPEFKPASSTMHPWTAWPNVQLMNLNRLGQGQTREMVDFLVNHKKIPEQVAEQILRKTDGVPLFIEELTKTLLEGDNFVLVGNDRYEVEGKMEEFEIPATLKDSLMARLDRLSTSKIIAQTAATIGREFSHSLLAAVVELEEPVLRHELTQLADAGLIFQRGLPPNATYIFKHALVQDAAYESQLKSRRQEMHRKINAVITKGFPEIVESQPETLAIHYAEAGMIPEAIAEWLRAGQQASGRSALAEAIVDYERGIALLATLPAASPARAYELPLQLSLGIALLMTRGYSAPEVAGPLSRARELCAAVPDAPQLPLILWSLWAYYLVRADHKESLPLAKELSQLAAARNDSGQVIEASFTLNVEYFVTAGGFRRSAEETKIVQDLYRIEKNACTVTGYVQDPLVCSLSWGAWAEWILGHPAEARALADQNIRHQEALGHPYSTAYGAICLGSLAVLMEDEAWAESVGNQGLKITSERGYPFLMAIAMATLGWVKGRNGGTLAESMQLFDQAIAIFNAMGSIFWRTLPYSWKIETHILHRDYAGARAQLNIAYEEAERIGEPFMLPVLKRLEADILLGEAKMSATTAVQAGLSPDVAAEELYREAITLARSFQAKAFELSALLRLHDLLQDSHKGKVDDRSSRVLEEIRGVYESYTDGFDLPLLVRTKKVLDGGNSLQHVPILSETSRQNLVTE